MVVQRDGPIVLCGLSAKGGQLKGFQVWAPQVDWKDAAARIDGATVVVPAPKDLGALLRVSYAFRYYPEGNLCNAADLPGSPFITEILQRK